MGQKRGVERARQRSTRRGKGEGSIFEQPNGTWRGKVTVGYTEDSKQRFKWVPEKTQAEAPAKVAEIKQRLAGGTYSDTKLTVKDYLETWLKEKERSVKARTAMLYKEQTERYAVPKIGSVKLDKLTPLHLQRMVSELADEVGVPTANKARTLMFAALKQAVRWGLIHRNPCEAVAKLKETRKEMTLWTPAETVHFLETARPHRLYGAFYLAVFAGLRRGELLGLRWKDLNGPLLSVRQSLTVLGGTPHFTTPKTRKGERHITLSPDVLEVPSLHRTLQQAEAKNQGDAWTDSGLIFVTEVGTLIHPRNFERTFKGLLVDAKAAWLRTATEAKDLETVRLLEADKLMQKARLHDLRHLHVSLLVSRGFDPRAIADRVGHTNPSFTLDVYSHMFATQRAQAAVGMADLLGTDARQRETN